MMELVNGKERTVLQMKELMDQSGWQLVQVHRSMSPSSSQFIGIPV